MEIERSTKFQKHSMFRCKFLDFGDARATAKVLSVIGYARYLKKTRLVKGRRSRYLPKVVVS